MDSVLKFIADNIHVVGWGSIIGAIAWAWRKSVSFSLDSAETRRQGKVAMEQINTMSTNHFPHMENALTDLNRKTDEGNVHLSEIATNLAVLGGIIKDRGRV